MSSSISSENCVDNNLEDSDLDDETQSPSKFRENVKRFLDEQRKARAKAKALLEEVTTTGESITIDGEYLDISDGNIENDEESFELEEMPDDNIQEMDKKEEENENVKQVMQDDLKNERREKQDNFERAKKGKHGPSYNNEVKEFADELDKFKSIPNPDDSKMSEHEFVKEVQYAFRKVLPRKVLDNMTSRKCGLCHDEFPRMREAWRHYRGYNHKRAVKCYVKGTFKGHPPFFKMCLEAIAESDTAGGSSQEDIYKFVNQKYSLNYTKQRTTQLIIWGIERLFENKYIKKNEEGGYYLVDPNLPGDKLPSLEMASSARKERGGPNNFSIITFERKIDDLFKKDLPRHLLKTLKPNYCGLCRVEIREADLWNHYEGSSHRRIVVKFSTEGTTEKNNRKRDSSSRCENYRRESDGYRRRDLKRPYEEERKRSHHSRGYSPKKNGSNENKRRGRSPSPKRARRDHARPRSSPFIHKDSRKLPTTQLPVVFINSSVGGEGPRALVIPKADPSDFA
jgi:hypothetical protein